MSRIFSHLVWPVIVLCLWVASAEAAATSFPVPARIAPNVAFWEKVYGHYSIREGVLHDRRNLALIYGTFPLEDPAVPGAGELNRQRTKAEVERIERSLLALASGAPPADGQQRRLAALFAGRSPQVIRQAAENVRAQWGLKERFQEGVRRSGAYLPEFRRVFADAGLPQELAYLPHVESSFDAEARSKAGAVGLWQFTRDTGKRYLTINHVLDERLDPWRSSQAAARYLKESHQALGDWPLALTSYNYGRAGMLRAKEALGSYERIFAEYGGGHFKFAARNFYPEFVAALRVARRMEADPAVVRDRPRYTATRELPPGLTIMEAAQRFAVSREDLIDLNPALLSQVVAGQRPIPAGYALRLPAAAPAPSVPKVVAATAPAKGKPRQVSAQTAKRPSEQKMLRYQVRRGTRSAVSPNATTSAERRLSPPIGSARMPASRWGSTSIFQRWMPRRRMLRCGR